MLVKQNLTIGLISLSNVYYKLRYVIKNYVVEMLNDIDEFNILKYLITLKINLLIKYLTWLDKICWLLPFSKSLDKHLYANNNHMNNAKILSD